MESEKEFNKELREEVGHIFADLYREIGNNRQQLANKVLGLHKELNKELNKSEVDAARKKEIQSEVSRIVKMAAQQLPHMKQAHPRPPVTATVKPAASPAKTVVPPAKVAAPPVKAASLPVKPVNPPLKAVASPAKPAGSPVKAASSAKAAASKSKSSTPKKKVTTRPGAPAKKKK